MKTYASFTDSQDGDLEYQVILGPFDPEFVQLTYNELRIAPHGDLLAVLNPNDGLWHLNIGYYTTEPVIKKFMQPHYTIESEMGYSDVVVYWENE